MPRAALSLAPAVPRTTLEESESLSRRGRSQPHNLQGPQLPPPPALGSLVAADVRQSCDRWCGSPSPSELGTLFPNVPLMPPSHPATEDSALHSGAGKEVEASSVKEFWQAGKSQQVDPGCGEQTVSHLGPCCLLDRARIMTIIIEIQGAVINTHLSSQDGISSIHLTTLRGREELNAEILLPCLKYQGN